MCGICGIVNGSGAPIEVTRLQRMRDLLTHRGPDEAGIWTAEGVGLGHRRLSIIDLKAGKQPLSNETGTIWITFNGEIYNYRTLRDELIRKGHEFRTHTDTEVLVHGYEEWGAELPRRLNGIFAFGIFDTEKQQLFLARDHLGVKPLFYALANGELAFASETPSILDALRLKPRTSADAIIEYLLFRYIAGDRTFFDGVNRLPPGHYGTWERGALTLTQYWSPSGWGTAPGSIDAIEAAAEFDGRLSAAVERQLMSDVPLGAFCSGGVDSGLTTYHAVRHSQAHDFRTYSVGVPVSGFDETALALTTSRSLGTAHRSIKSEAAHIRDGLLSLMAYGYEPLSHPNMVPLLDLSGLARQDVTVVLTGEGADELFCGYPRYQVVRAHAMLPDAVRGSTRLALRSVPGHRAAKLRRALDWSPEDAILFNSAFVDPLLVEQLVGAPIGPALDHRRKLLRQNAVSGDPLESISRYELTTYLVSALERLDRVSMAVGLEARVPFLDIDLVEWGLELPSSLKVRGRTSKATVKRAARGKLDSRIVNGRKSGFGLPLDHWFRGPVFTPLLDRLLAADHPASEFLDPSVVGMLVRDHRAGESDQGELLWLLVNLYIWFEQHTGAEVASPAVLSAVG